MRILALLLALFAVTALAAEPRYWESTGPSELDLQLSPLPYVARSASEVRPESKAAASRIDFSKDELVQVGTPPFADGGLARLPADGGETSGTVIWFPMFREKRCATPPDGGYEEGDPDDPTNTELQWVYFDKWEELLIPSSTPSPINIGVIQVDVPCGSDIQALRKSWRVPDDLQTHRIFGYAPTVLRLSGDLSRVAGSIPDELKSHDFRTTAVVIPGRPDQVLTDWHPISVPPERIRALHLKQFTLERVSYTCNFEVKCEALTGEKPCTAMLEGPSRLDDSALHRLYVVPKTDAFISLKPVAVSRPTPRAACEREGKLFVIGSLDEARRRGIPSPEKIEFFHQDLAVFGDGPYDGRPLWNAKQFVHVVGGKRLLDVEIVDTWERDNGCCGVHHPCDPAGLPTEAVHQSTTANLGIIYVLPKSELPLLPHFVLRQQYVCPNEGGTGFERLPSQR